MQCKTRGLILRLPYWNNLELIGSTFVSCNPGALLLAAPTQSSPLTLPLYIQRQVHVIWQNLGIKMIDCVITFKYFKYFLLP